MKKLILIAIFACSSLLYGQTRHELVVLNDNPNTLKMVSVTEEGVVFRLQIGSFYKQAIEINGEEYFAVNLDKESLIKEKGFPELPKFARSIMIPGTSDFKARIISAEYEDINLPIIPSKGILSRSIDPDEVPYSFSSLSTIESFYPNERFDLGEPYLIRDARGFALNVHPFAYNPEEKVLRIYTDMEFKIDFTGTNLENSFLGGEYVSNEYFEQALRLHFSNYNLIDILENLKVVREKGKMLIICNNNFLNAMQPFVAHKNYRGLNTEIVNMDYVGSTAVHLRDYIKYRYDNDKSIAFVLLVGDHAQMPSLLVNDRASDPSFSLVSGSDNYPDIIIGRFSAENVAHVQTMVARSITYENMLEQDWFHSGVGIASSQGAGAGDDNEADWEHSRNIRTSLLNWHYNAVSELYDGSKGGSDAAGNPSSTMLRDLVNAGVSIINYTGHGTTSSWITTGFSNYNINALTNDNKLPFIFSVACSNGNFTSSSNCFAESWLRAKNSNTNKPTGAIGFYGSSISQDWAPPMQAQDKFNELLVKGHYLRFGALCYASSWSMMNVYGDQTGESGANMFLTWHIFGDPSLVVIPHVHPKYNFSIWDDEITPSSSGSDNILKSNHKKKEILNLDSEVLQEGQAIRMFPNPIVNETINIEFLNSDKPRNISIFDAKGQLVYSNENPANKISINKFTERGVYFVRVIAGKKVHTYKVVKE